MKNRIILSTVFALLLTACGSTQTDLPQSSDSLPISTQLMLGTLQLEDTDQAVTGEQAKALLPMWQVYQTLTSSGSAAQAEIDGLVEQIQETMTAEQMQTMAAMNLSQQDVFTSIQEQGMGMGQTQGSNVTSQNNAGFSPPDAGLSGGAPPDGGMGGTGPIVGAEQGQETEAGTGANRNVGVATVLIDELIHLLEQKAGT